MPERDELFVETGRGTKAPYSAPKLTVYGDVVDLTKTGKTSGTADGGGTGNTMP